MPTPTSARVFIEHGNYGHGGFHRHDLLGLRGRANAALSAVSGELRADAIVLTIVFAAYVVSLLAALLTVGSLSDYIGRRPAIMAALVLNIVAMLMFVAADSAGALIAARAVQGFATGLATATLGATILDTDRIRGPVLNSVTAFAGLTAGSLGAAALVTYAPDPRQFVYLVLLALSAVEMLILWYMPENWRPSPGCSRPCDLMSMCRPRRGAHSSR